MHARQPRGAARPVERASRASSFVAAVAGVARPAGIQPIAAGATLPCRRWSAERGGARRQRRRHSRQSAQRSSARVDRARRGPRGREPEIRGAGSFPDPRIAAVEQFGRARGWPSGRERRRSRRHAVAPVSGAAAGNGEKKASAARSGRRSVRTRMSISPNRESRRRRSSGGAAPGGWLACARPRLSAIDRTARSWRAGRRRAARSRDRNARAPTGEEKLDTGARKAGILPGRRTIRRVAGDQRARAPPPDRIFQARLGAERPARRRSSRRR